MDEVREYRDGQSKSMQPFHGQTAGRPIEYRDFRLEDDAALVRITFDTWDMASLFQSEVLGLRMAREYLHGCLQKATLARVAVRDGTPVGFLLARRKHSPPILLPEEWFKPERLEHIDASERFAIEKYRAILDQYTKECEALLHESGQDFDGEIVLFAVRSDLRGNGIGKKLYSHAVGYFQQTRFFLYTDSGCNYSFYEVQGMKKQAESSIASPNGKGRLKIFLYANVLSQKPYL